MHGNQAAIQRGNSVALLIVAALQLFVCEAQLLIRFWDKGRGQTGFDGVTQYLLPVIVAFPLIAALVERRRFKRWEESGDLPSTAAARISLDMGTGLMVTYAIISMLAN